MRHLHAPLGQILHGGLPDQLREATGKRRPREARLLRKSRNGPVPSRLRVNRPKRSSHVFISDRGNPPAPVVGDVVDPRSNHLDDENVGQTRDDGLSSRLGNAGLAGNEPQGTPRLLPVEQIEEVMVCGGDGKPKRTHLVNEN